MNTTSPLGLLGICVAFAITAFLGGMAASLLIGGSGSSNAAAVAQPTATIRAGGPTGVGAIGITGATGATGGTGATGAAVAPTQPPVTPPTATPAAPTATPAPTTYTVVAGDNPTLIAQKLKVPAADQAAWVQSFLTLNSTTANALSLGKAYKLPPNTPGAAPAAAVTTPAASGATTTPPAGGAAAATATRTP